jgi:hypothetical protein
MCKACGKHDGKRASRKPHEPGVAYGEKCGPDGEHMVEAADHPLVGQFCVNEQPVRLGHESLDVTLAYLKGKDSESEEAQEHPNSSSLTPYA